MYKPPRWYYRLSPTLNTYDEYIQLKKENLSNAERRQDMLNIIKRIFVSYWKFLKDMLRENGITEYYPRRIFKIAVQKGMINESELVWIEYINLLNQIIYDIEKDSQAIAEKIINNYENRIPGVIDYMKNRCASVASKEEICDTILQENQPIYDCSILNIPDYAYQILINYFISVPEIKKIWLHGSRSVGQAKVNSDIDLLADCPMESYETIQYQINKLRIPYRIDISSIHDESKKLFLQMSIPFAKIIYRKEDFK